MITSPQPNPVPETGGISKTRKIAALLVMLGPEPASQILKEFEGPELDAIASELTNLTVIDQELQIEVLREFGEIAVQASTALSGGAEFVQTALVKAVGESKASSIIHKVAPNYVSVPALQQILKSEPREVF